MKRKPSDLIFKVDHQFTLYLQRSGVSRAQLPPDQFREMRRAFYGAASQFLFMFTQDITELRERDGAQVLTNITNEITEFWNNETKADKAGMQEYAPQMRVKCRQCAWEGIVSELINPEKGDRDNRCMCPKCRCKELLVPKGTI